MYICTHININICDHDDDDDAGGWQVLGNS